MKLSIIPFILTKLKQGLGIVQDTDTATQAIAKDKYVFWKGSLKKASSAISQNDTLSASNLGDVTEGALNELSEHIASVDDKTKFPSASSGGGLGLQMSTDSGNNFMVFRLIQNAENTNYYQVIFWGTQKKITIVKGVNGVETTVATFSGT